MTEETTRAAALERRLLADCALSFIRHDVRNKLASIRSANFYINRKLPPEANVGRVKDFLALIDGELRAAEEILGAHQSPERIVTPTSLEAAVHTALEGRPIPAGIRLQLRLENSAPHRIDVAEVAVLVRCLLDNALEALGSEGMISVELTKAATESCLCVSDDGAGFGEDLAKPLERYHSTKAGHNGFGLNLAAWLASRNGAKIRLANRAPGATVEVLFPNPANSGAP